MTTSGISSCVSKGLYTIVRAALPIVADWVTFIALSRMAKKSVSEMTASSISFIPGLATLYFTSGVRGWNGSNLDRCLYGAYKILQFVVIKNNKRPEKALAKPACVPTVAPPLAKLAESPTYDERVARANKAYAAERRRGRDGERAQAIAYLNSLNASSNLGFYTVMNYDPKDRKLDGLLWATKRIEFSQEENVKLQEHIKEAELLFNFSGEHDGLQVSVKDDQLIFDFINTGSLPPGSYQFLIGKNFVLIKAIKTEWESLDTADREPGRLVFGTYHSPDRELDPTSFIWSTHSRDNGRLRVNFKKLTGVI